MYYQITELPSARIKKALSIRNMKQVDLANKTGINKANISAYITGKYIPKTENLRKIAEALDVNLGWIAGLDIPMEGGETANKLFAPNIIPLPTTNEVPLISFIASMDSVEMNLQEELHCDICLCVNDNSMIDARIGKGDLVYIKEQPLVDNGEIAAVQVGDETVLRRAYLRKDSLTLVPGNSSYEPVTYTGPSLDNIKILGKVIGFTSIVK